MSRIGLALALGAGLLAMARSASRRHRESPSGGILGTGRGDLERIQRRYEDARMRAAALAWGALFFPDMPLSALMAGGVTATSRTERGGPPDYAAGLYGYELTASGRARARDEQTVRQFGREIDTGAESFGADIEAQTYLGFRSYREHLDHVVSTLPLELRPIEGSVWCYLLAVSAYSSGDSKVSAVVRGAGVAALRVAPVTARVDAHEPMWTRLGRAVLARLAGNHSTIGGIEIAGRWNAAYLVLRALRRFRAGRAVALAVPELAPERAWYEGHDLAADLAADLQRAVG